MRHHRTSIWKRDRPTIVRQMDLFFCFGVLALWWLMTRGLWWVAEEYPALAGWFSVEHYLISYFGGAVLILMILVFAQHRLKKRIAEAGGVLWVCTNRRCRYKLNGLEPAGRCPECGREYSPRLLTKYWGGHWDGQEYTV